MQESTASALPTSHFPLWARIAFACFMFSSSAVEMWDKFLAFDWVPFLCFGLCALLYLPIQQGETRKAYYSKPRTIFLFALGIVIVITALYDLHYLLAKHRL